MTIESTHQLAEDALTKLAELLDQGQSETLTAYLATLARFHRYSFGNALLIHFQRPDATRVAGFQAWRRLGRIVQRGEKGIAILAPCVYRRKDEGDGPLALDEPDERRLRGFKVAHVFDVSQTYGDPLPEFAQVRGQPGAYLPQLKQLVEARGIVLEYTTELHGADGTSSGGRIQLRAGLDLADEFGVLVHELAHEVLHHGAKDKSRRTVELEAEAVAYVVCQAIGLDTNTAASDYIQLYHGDRQALEASLATIQRTASAILTDLGLTG